MNKKLLFPLLIAVLAAIFASQNPDGLDKVSEMLGFAHKGVEHPAIMAGYNLPFLGASKLSAILAGIAGVMLTYGIFMLGLYLARKHSMPRGESRQTS